MSAVLLEIIALLTSGITEFAAGIGAGLSALAQNIFLSAGTDGGYTLSTFGGLIIVFAAISLTIGLSRMVVNWVTSLGN